MKNVSATVQAYRIGEWTDADCAAAEREGWNLFNVETSPEIQRDDESAVFLSDEDAAAFVRSSQAPHCIKASALVAAAPQ